MPWFDANFLDNFDISSLNSNLASMSGHYKSLSITFILLFGVALIGAFGFIRLGQWFNYGRKESESRKRKKNNPNSIFSIINYSRCMAEWTNGVDVWRLQFFFLLLLLSFHAEIVYMSLCLDVILSWFTFALSRSFGKIVDALKLKRK